MAVTGLDVGLALAMFNKTSGGLQRVDQYVLQLPEMDPPLTCNLTSLIDITDSNIAGNNLYVTCENFLPVSHGNEVEMWIFSVSVNFDFLNESQLSLRYSHRLSFLSTGLSIPFFFDSDICPTSRLVWYDDAILYVLRVDSGSGSLDALDTMKQECYGNNVTRVKRLGDDRLVAFCSGDIAVEINVCEAGGDDVPTETYPTRFQCSENVFLEQNGSVLMSPWITIPHPLNTSIRYVADCIEFSSRVYFIGSSDDGTIALSNVLENITTILANGAAVSHRVFDNRFLLYSNVTSTVMLDLTCTEPTNPIQTWNVPFHLATLDLTEQPLCYTANPSPTMAPPPETTPNHGTPNTTVISNGTDSVGGAELTGWGIAGIIIGIVVIVSVLILTVVAVLVWQCQESCQAGNR